MSLPSTLTVELTADEIDFLLDRIHNERIEAKLREALGIA